MTPGRLYLHLRRYLGYQVELQRARIRWRTWGFSGSPVLFANAMAKSGSKLLRQIMLGIQKIGPFKPVQLWPIRTITWQGRTRTPLEIEGDLSGLTRGDIGLGFLHATDQNLTYMTQDDWVTFSLIRDPRDLLISSILFATEAHENHSMRPRYLAEPDMESRINLAIRGTDSYPHLPNVRERYQHHLGFLDHPGIMTLRFERLRTTPFEAVHQMLAFIEARSPLSFADPQAAVEAVVGRIEPSRSPTFRKGLVGEWREHFTEDNKRVFKEVAGDLLTRLGYEEDERW